VTLDTRALRLLVLASWSVFLLWLWLSGEVLLYLGPRTDWVVTFGAVALTGATAIYAYTTRDSTPTARPRAGELAGYAALLVPILVAALVSGGSLGALAASKKLTARGVDLAALAELEADRTQGISFLTLRGAGQDQELADREAIHPGRPVRLNGFVSETGDGRDEPFELSRFYITCCVADAIPVGIKVATRGGPTPRKDQWLEVTGVVARFGDEFGIRAQKTTVVPRPAHPYLSFAGS
jgi:putative membrane protein